MYAGLLSFNESLLLRVATKLLSKILCDIQFGFYVHFKYSFLLFTSFTSILFLQVSYAFPYVALLMNLLNAFQSLSLFFSASILFCVLNSMYGFNHCD